MIPADMPAGATPAPLYGCKHGSLSRTARGNYVVEGDAHGLLCSLWETYRAVVEEKDAEIATLHEALRGLLAAADSGTLSDQLAASVRRLRALTACQP